jgi:F0F1-type ATP synthase assembly protein I
MLDLKYPILSSSSIMITLNLLGMMCNVNYFLRKQSKVPQSREDQNHVTSEDDYF